MRLSIQHLLASALVVLAVPLHAQKHPKLIVVVVVDQMRADYLERFGAYETGGFHFLTTQGAEFANANYEHVPTETCLGHSVLLSGRNPARTGIVANEWYDRKSENMTYCVQDDDSPLIREPGAAVSPKNLLGDNFSDWVQSSYPGARVFSIALKDRAAILMAGHHPQGVFWFSHETGNFVTSRYYSTHIPDGIKEFNEAHVISSYAGKQWQPILETKSPAYHTHQVDGQFPHAMPNQPGDQLNNAVYESPFGDELLERLAEAVVKSNRLGDNQNKAPDLLEIGFSSNDAIGHKYGPDSPEIADEQIRLDRTLGRLVDGLTARLGSGQILWVLSADHGAEPTPEAERTLRQNGVAQRIPFSDALKSVEAQLDTIFKVSGNVHWFAGKTDTMLYFDRAELARHNITLQAAGAALATQVKNVPGVDGFYAVSHLETVKNDIGRILRNSAFPDRSGDVYYLTSEWTLFSSKATGTSHGDPWPYNSHVPLILAGWHIAPRLIKNRMQMVDLAPTLADLTGVHWPQAEYLDGKSMIGFIKVSRPTSTSP